MKKIESLKKNYEFKNVFEKGKYYKGQLLELFIVKQNNGSNRIGIAVSKKVGNSVERNKIKRLIRENYRMLEKQISEGNQIIILWNKKVEKEKANFYSIQEDLMNILKKAEILKK